MPGIETEVDGVRRTINRAIEKDPFTPVSSTRHDEQARRANRFQLALELRRIPVHPAHNGGVGHRQATLDLQQVPEAELEARIPPHAQDDDLAIEKSSLAPCLQTQEASYRAALKHTDRSKDR